MWSKLDDDFYHNAKTDYLHGQAHELYTSALSYCGKHLNDGFLTEHDVEILLVIRRIPRAVVEELTRPVPPDDTPFWEIVEGGYRVHNYLKRNPSKEKVKRERQASETRYQAYLDRQEEIRLQRLAATVPEPVPNAVQNAVPNTVANAVTNAVANAVSNGVTNTVPDPDPVPVPESDSGMLTHPGPSRDEPSEHGSTEPVLLTPRRKPTPATGPPARASPSAQLARELWAALATALRYDPRSNGSEPECAKWNGAIKRLASVQVTGDEIGDLVVRFGRLFPSATCTPHALANNVAMLRSLAPPSRSRDDRAVARLPPETLDPVDLAAKWAGHALPGEERNSYGPPPTTTPNGGGRSSHLAPIATVPRYDGT